MRKGEWCCEEYFAQVYGFEAMARDAGYESVQEFLQDARNSYDVKAMRAIRQFRREARLFDERYEPPRDVLRAKHVAIMAQRAARTLAGLENGGCLAGTTVVLAGTSYHNASGRLYRTAPGAAGVYGARVSFAGRRRWSTKDEFVDLLCDAGADVIDYALTTGTEQLAAWFGSSESIAELQDRNYFCCSPNDWPAPNSSERVAPALHRFLADDVWFREDVVDRFLASGAESFFEWAARAEHSVFRKVRLLGASRDGGTSTRIGWSPRATGPDGTVYQVGADVALVRRSTREVPVPEPAVEPTPLDEDITPLDEDMEELNPLRGADPPKWAEKSRSAKALELIFAVKPKLISDPPPDSRERRAIATRLCGPPRSTAPDDVDLFDRAFRWGDEQWTKWHEANDSSSEEEDEEDDDPFAEHKVPPVTRANRPRLLELYKLKFGVPPPPKGNSESRLFPGSFYDWVRYKIVNG